MWTVRLEFALKHNGDDWWETCEDTHEQAFQFKDEGEARVFFSEAVVAADCDWVDDETPSPEALEFPRKHSITLYNLDGVPDGGFIEGAPVGLYKLALLSVLQVVEFRDLTHAWRGR